MKHLLLLATAAAALGQTPVGSPELPLALKQAIPLPEFVKGNFDHFGVDLVRQRLFVTAENVGAVLVLDFRTGEIIQTLRGFGKPHAILYRDDVDRLYVTDGSGELKTFSGSTYQPGPSVKLLEDADSIGYDISTKLLYIDNGGKDVHQKNSVLTVVDTTEIRKVADLSLTGETLEAMALDVYRPRLYVNNRSENRIDVLDRFQRKLLLSWPLTLAKDNVAIALDEPHQRLFVGCRTGKMIVMDSNTGVELQALPIAQGVDDVIYDPATRRIYASGNESMSVFLQVDADHYEFAGAVPTGVSARTSRLIPEANRLFVAVPEQGTEAAKILAFEPQGTTATKPKASDPIAYSVHAAKAEELVRATLSSHQFLRKLGLHAVAPGQTTSVIIANGNATRIGIPTTKSDFEAVKDGTTYCKRIDNGAFYNMKMPMFDAAGRRIGLLVMEIPRTSAKDEADAIRVAEDIRSQMEQSIPDLNSLFDKQGMNL